MGGGEVCCNIFKWFFLFKKKQRKILSFIHNIFSCSFDAGFGVGFRNGFVTDFITGYCKNTEDFIRENYCVVEGFLGQLFSFPVHSSINLSTMFFILIGDLHICSTYKGHTHMLGHHPCSLSHHAEKLENVFIEDFHIQFHRI